MSLDQEGIGAAAAHFNLAPGQPEHLAPLAEHLAGKIRANMDRFEGEGKTVEVYGPDWSRGHPEAAGQMHADLILATYGSTYALPNKDPMANTEAIKGGTLDVYFMLVDGKPTGTCCLVDVGDGRAELGRAAGTGGGGNSVILDLRILDWLTNPDMANKYHTLFSTLRTAPDRLIEEEDFVMKGGQAITQHWRNFPGIRVSGVAPLYYKHGALEQFTVAEISRSELDPTRPLYIANPLAAGFIGRWHDQYGLPYPDATPEDPTNRTVINFEAHYPPAESGITDLVHADIVASEGPNAKGLLMGLEEVRDAGSPFTQVVLPVDRDTRHHQRWLERFGFQVFGYRPASEHASAALLYGRVRDFVDVVPTHWSENQAHHPFWHDDALHAAAEAIAAKW